MEIMFLSFPFVPFLFLYVSSLSLSFLLLFFTFPVLYFTFPFPECVARVPVSFGGVGAGPCSPIVVSVSATVRNRPQPSATVCVSAVRLSTVASASGVVPKACQVDSLSSQLYWRLQRRCLCE